MNFLKSTFLIAFSFSTFCHAQNFDGYALYNKQNNNNTYLIDKDGNIAHTWNCNVACNYAVLLKENGNIVRGGKYNGNQLNGAAIGGMVQEIDPSGNVVWEYVYSNSNHCQHHDICLIGDNVLLTAWEVKTANQVTAAGYSTNSDKWPTHFVELQPDGNGSASIVWEWHIWDHLIQDVDPNKPSYGNIADNPQLIDINMIQSQGGGGPGGGGGDWFHVNGVDYNADLDQIAFTSRFASEFYIIDHSTSTTEAASHSGGNSGMGGDILYRWGNPSNYNTSGSQIVPDAVHDVRWIEDDGRPNGGFLQVFNNEGAGNNQSTIDAVDATGSAGNGYTYNKTPGQAFEPTSYSWRHTCAYSAPGQSASNRMSNGNIFVNCSGGQGGAGIMYETDPTGNNIIWQYNGGGPAKAFRYECDYPGIITLLNNPCMVDLDNIANEKINIYPNPSSGLFTIYGLNSSLINIHIIDAFGKTVLESSQKEFDLSTFATGLYNVIIEKENGALIIKKISLNK